jgi:hypothetical protein
MSPGRTGAAAMIASAAIAAGYAGGGAIWTAQASAVEKNPRYALTPTSRCLKSRGAKVGAVKPSDKRLRALRDFTQRRSIQVVLKGKLVGLAFLDGPGEARILADLLKVPHDPYRLVRRGNALLMYKPSAKKAFDAAASCLRA